MTQNEKKVLTALAALLDPELSEHIQFTNDAKQNAPIRISFRDKLLPGEEETFSQTIRGLALDFEPIKSLLTDRLLSDYGTSKKSIGKKLSSSRLVITAINTGENIDTNFSDLDAYKEQPIRKLSEHQLARLIEHIYQTWLELPGDLRRPRKISDKHIRGYIKLRDDYSHDDIINGIIVYGKWAGAYAKAMENEENPKIFWFYRWDLDKFMNSNKAMSHVDGGWRDVVQSKQIPSEYAKVDAEKKNNQIQDRKAKWIDDYTDRVLRGENVEADAHIAESYADDIEIVLERKRNAS